LWGGPFWAAAALPRGAARALRTLVIQIGVSLFLCYAKLNRRNHGYPHASGRQQGGCGFETNFVIAKFNNLSVSQKQDILNFLRSL
jgi:hypothetical protein